MSERLVPLVGIVSTGASNETSTPTSMPGADGVSTGPAQLASEGPQGEHGDVEQIFGELSMEALGGPETPAQVEQVFGGIVMEAEGNAAPGGQVAMTLGGIVIEAEANVEINADVEMVFGALEMEAIAATKNEGVIEMIFGGLGGEAEAFVPIPARTTQAPRLVVSEVQTDARATQASRLVVAEIEVPGRTTQATRLTVEEILVDARATQAVRLIIAEAVPCVTKWQQLWKIRRKDGQVFRYTSLDVDFTWGSELYKACGSLNPSAAEDASQVGQVANQELAGIFKDDGILENELYGGLFDDAFVEVWLVPYEGTESPRRLAAGWTGNMLHSEHGFSMEVVGPGARLDQQALVQVYGPGCRWVFGSPECGYDREAQKLSGTVDVAFTRGSFIGSLVGASGATGESGVNELQWSNGLVRWITGPNTSKECEVHVATFDDGTVTVELWELTGLLPETGDEFELLPGCDLSFPTCKDVYDNAINFGGFKDVPGEDSVLQTPDAKIS